MSCLGFLKVYVSTPILLSLLYAWTLIPREIPFNLEKNLLNRTTYGAKKE